MLNRKTKGNTTVFSDGDKTVLTIETKQADNGILVTLTGKLCSETAHEIQVELIRFATVDASVVVDMCGVTYISPSVQHAFLNVQQEMDAMGKGSMVLRGMTDTIYGEFDKNGASELLMIED